VKVKIPLFAPFFAILGTRWSHFLKGGITGEKIPNKNRYFEKRYALTIDNRCFPCDPECKVRGHCPRIVDEIGSHRSDTENLGTAVDGNIHNKPEKRTFFSPEFTYQTVISLSFLHVF